MVHHGVVGSHLPRWGLMTMVAVTACAPSSQGFGDGAVTDVGVGEGSGTGLNETTSSTTTVVPPVGTTSDGSTTASMTTSTSEPESTDTTGGSSGDPPVTAHSCDELLEDDSTARTGVHMLLDGDEAPYEAFCLMDFQGSGGWTLVGRSRPDAQDVPFGWRSERGSVDDHSDAYSLGAWVKGLEFTEVLVADHEPGESVPFERAYVIVMPADFVDDHENSTVESSSVTTVLGDCDPGGGPSMMSYLGYTGRTDVFFVRDNMGNDNFGLQADHWALAHDNCNQGGQLNDTQGVMFVR